jgi:hypothetical protein
MVTPSLASINALIGEAAPHLDRPLPPLPGQIVGPPFGFDAQGKPIKDANGSLTRTTIEFMLACVEWRARQEGGDVAAARQAAQQALVARLNAAVPDPRFQVTFDYLMQNGNNYSLEYSVYLVGICRELAHEPLFSFKRGIFSGQPLSYLVRPLPMAQAYQFAPRLAAKMLRADLRVKAVRSPVAVIQWRVGDEAAKVNESLVFRYTIGACHAFQGALAALPHWHSGLPLANIHERRCQLQGDDHCEWAFEWPAAPQRRWFFGRAAQPQPSTFFAPAPAPAPVEAARNPWPTITTAQRALPPLPPRLLGPPYGFGPDGKPIRYAQGTLIVPLIKLIGEMARQQAAAQLPATLSPTERRARLAEAEVTVLAQWLARLNAALPKPLPPFTLADLNNLGNSYSEEFLTHAYWQAQAVLNEPQFFFKIGVHVAQSLAYLVRPFGLEQGYRFLPSITSRLTEIRLEAVDVRPGYAHIRWLGCQNFDRIPEPVRPHYIYATCQGLMGVLANMPYNHGGPFATWRELQCKLDGAPHCEWEFTWPVAEKPPWLGAAHPSAAFETPPESRGAMWGGVAFRRCYCFGF